MSKGQKKITQLHQKYRAERDARTHLSEAVIQAIMWWKTVNKKAVSLVEDLSKLMESQYNAQFAYNNTATGWNAWLSKCPLLWVRKVAMRVWGVQKEWENPKQHTVNSLKVEVLLGDGQKLKLLDIATATGISVPEVSEIIKELGGKVSTGEPVA